VRLTQQQLRCLDVTEDRAERLGDFVSHGCRYFAYKSEPGSMRNLRVLSLRVGAGTVVAPVLHQ
jgi:hypothetical protein